MDPARMEQLIASIDECNANRKWQESIDLFAAAVMGGMPLSTRLGNAALLAYSKLSRASEAVALLREMTEKGVPSDLDSYGRVIAACVKAKEWEQTLEVFAALKDNHLQPGTVLYNSALMACSNVGKLDLAQELFEEAQRAGGTSAPDIVTHTCMLSVYSQQGHWWRALRLYKADVLPHMAPDVIFMLTILETLWHSGSLTAMRHAVIIFRDARRAGHLYHVTPYTGGAPELSLHSSTVASCELHLYTWFTMLRSWIRRTKQELPNVRVFFVKRVRTFAVRFSDVIAARMRGLGCEATFADVSSANPSLHWSGAAMTAFLSSECKFLDLVDPDLPDELMLESIVDNKANFPAEVQTRTAAEMTQQALRVGSHVVQTLLEQEISLHFDLAERTRQLLNDSARPIDPSAMPAAYLEQRPSVVSFFDAAAGSIECGVRYHAGVPPRAFVDAVTDTFECGILDVHNGLALLDHLMSSGEADLTDSLLSTDISVALLVCTAACLPNPTQVVQRMQRILEPGDSETLSKCIGLLWLVCSRASPASTTPREPPPPPPPKPKPRSADTLVQRPMHDLGAPRPHSEARSTGQLDLNLSAILPTRTAAAASPAFPGSTFLSNQDSPSSSMSDPSAHAMYRRPADLVSKSPPPPAAPASGDTAERARQLPSFSSRMLPPSGPSKGSATLFSHPSLERPRSTLAGSVSLMGSASFNEGQSREASLRSSSSAQITFPTSKEPFLAPWGPSSEAQPVWSMVGSTTDNLTSSGDERSNISAPALPSMPAETAQRLFGIGDDVSPFDLQHNIKDTSHMPNFKLQHATQSAPSHIISEWWNSSSMDNSSLAMYTDTVATSGMHSMTTQRSAVWSSLAPSAPLNTSSVPELGSVPTVPSAAAFLDLMLQRLASAKAAMPQLVRLRPWAWAVLSEVVGSPLSLDVSPQHLAALVLTCCYAACGAGFGAPRAAIALVNLPPSFMQDTQPQLEEVKRLVEKFGGVRLPSSLVEAPGRERGTSQGKSRPAQERQAAEASAAAAPRRNRSRLVRPAPRILKPPPPPPPPLSFPQSLVDQSRLQLAFELGMHAGRRASSASNVVNPTPLWWPRSARSHDGPVRPLQLAQSMSQPAVGNTPPMMYARPSLYQAMQASSSSYINPDASDVLSQYGQQFQAPPVGGSQPFTYMLPHDDMLRSAHPERQRQQQRPYAGLQASPMPRRGVVNSGSSQGAALDESEWAAQQMALLALQEHPSRHLSRNTSLH